MTTATALNPADILAERWLDEIEEHGPNEFSDSLAEEWFDSLLAEPA